MIAQIPEFHKWAESYQTETWGWTMSLQPNPQASDEQIHNCQGAGVGQELRNYFSTCKLFGSGNAFFIVLLFHS